MIICSTLKTVPQTKTFLGGVFTNMLVFITGIHAGWTSPSLKKIISDEYPFEISEEGGSYIAIIGFVGDIVGGISGSFLIDKLGRKNTLISIFVPYFLSFLLIALSNFSPSFLYCARILGGVGEGATFAVLPIYVAEVAEPEIRGKLGTLQHIIISIGQIFINIITEYINIQNVATICLFFPILYVITFLHMPETPYYLLSKNKKAAALNSLRVLRRSSNVEKELNQLDFDVQRQMSEQGGFKELFIVPANRKALTLANCTRFFQQMTGCTAFSTYYQLIIEKSTNISPMVGTTALLILQIALTFISYNLIDFYGRKSLLILSASLTCIVHFFLGGFIVLRDFTSVDTSSFDMFPLIMIFFYVVTFIIGYGAVTNILIAEMYSASIKSKATALTSVNMSLMMITTVKYYQFLADNISLAVPFLTFAIFTFFSIFFLQKCLIETKGKSLEMIQKELMGSRNG